MMEKVRLGECATFINGYAFKPIDWSRNGIPIIRIQNLTGSMKQLNYYNGKLDSKYIINNGDILISWSASLGIFEWKKEKAYLNQHIFKVEFNKKNINKKYFVYLIKSKINEMKKNTHGSTMKHITKSDFDKIEIFLPNIQEQEKISNILDKVQQIIDLRKRQIEELDEFIKSLFIEMFENNDCETKKWQDVFNTTTGKLDSNAMIEGGIYPFFTCAKESFRINEYAFDCEALLLAGNNAAGVYDVKHYKGKFNAYQRTYVLTLKNEKWKYELFKLELEEKLDFLKSQSKGSNTRYLTMKILNDLTFKVPDLNLQNKFAELVKQINKQKFILEKTLKETEELQESLMNKYFN